MNHIDVINRTFRSNSERNRAKQICQDDYSLRVILCSDNIETRNKGIEILTLEVKYNADQQSAMQENSGQQYHNEQTEKMINSSIVVVEEARKLLAEYDANYREKKDIQKPVTAGDPFVISFVGRFKTGKS